MNINPKLVFSIGVGIVISMVLLAIYFYFNDIERFGYGSGYKTAKLKNKLSRIWANQKTVVINKKDKYIVYILTLLLITTANDITQIPRLLFWGILLSLGILLIYKHTVEKSNRSKKLKEAAILFEAIELYMKAGYSLYQSIKASRLLVHSIRPAVDLCLNYWGSGAKVALLKLQDELELEEVNTLILLLMNMEGSGISDSQDSISRQVFSIESLQKMKSQIKIANRPLMFVIYRMLPFASIAGIVVGGLLYRTYNILGQTGFINF